ncbi:MAG: hypothetical protein GWN30_20570 [Gammaproteobacteria bacterium]|nr:hypothetical protein [Gammaproteobacteria bacterium]NIW98793.1 hypothetical protein [Phycisphaerae bacterium]
MDTTDYELWLAINGLSKHPGKEEQYNQENNGAGITVANGNNRLSIGQYQNSINRLSQYVDYLRELDLGYIKPGLAGGVVTGYGDPQPYILPNVAIGNDNYRANIRYTPEVDGVTPETWMLNFEYRLK